MRQCNSHFRGEHDDDPDRPARRAQARPRPSLLLLFIVGDILGTGNYALTGQQAAEVAAILMGIGVILSVPMYLLSRRRGEPLEVSAPDDPPPHDIP